MTEREPSRGPQPPVVYEPQPGELFADRYRIDRLLGRGATGAVWAALDEEVGDRIALKLLTAGPEDAVERFRREVRLARRVTHRNAARIFDLGAAAGALYLTMEMVDGESLQDILSRQAVLEVAQAVDIGSQIANGLAAAHDVGVVHRDIKPANVLLDLSGRVVLTDFGLARAMASDTKLTLGPTMMGTPSYMAPEQVRGGTVGPASDLYALGAVLYEMLTGRCPFVREGVVATAMARLEEDPQDPREQASIPDDLAALVLDCLQRSPERRPGSAAGVAVALAEMGARYGSPDTTTTLFSVAATPGRRPQHPPSVQGPHSSANVGSTFISLSPLDRTLAVLPFRHRGAPEYDHFAAVMAEDLVDVLSATRGLRVSASSATAKYEGQPVDPREAGRELAVDAIVDGTVRTRTEGLRISARLIDVATGEQLWVDTFDESLADIEAVQETIAQRIAESLRLELELLGARHGVSEEAVDLLLEARQRTEASGLGDDAFGIALELLDRALALEPEFGLAIATHAEFSVRRWFLPAGPHDEAIAKRAHESVDRALTQAPDLPLTHFAAGRLAVSDGRFVDAARELALALSLAPTYAAVHDYLGMLQCEAGRGDEGERHLELARRIDPSLPIGPSLARRCALARDLDGYRQRLAEMRATGTSSRFMVDSLEMRVAGWFGDRETVRRYRPSSLIPPESPAFAFLEAQRAALLGETTEAVLLDTLAGVLGAGSGPRLDAFLRQMAIEALAPLGAEDAALEHLRILTATPAFVDTEWLERCPALDGLRQRPELDSIIAEARRRAAAIWRVRLSV